METVIGNPPLGVAIRKPRPLVFCPFYCHSDLLIPGQYQCVGLRQRRASISARNECNKQQAYLRVNYGFTATFCVHLPEYAPGVSVPGSFILPRVPFEKLFCPTVMPFHWIIVKPFKIHESYLFGRYCGKCSSGSFPFSELIDPPPPPPPPPNINRA